MNQYGAELLLEISRFWAGKASLDTATGHYTIGGVMGPDEFHEKYPHRNKGGLDNNAYSNLMAAWVLQKTMEILEGMDSENRTSLFIKTGFNTSFCVKWSIN